jgi:hypothetical protein
VVMSRRRRNINGRISFPRMRRVKWGRHVFDLAIERGGVRGEGRERLILILTLTLTSSFLILNQPYTNYNPKQPSREP